MGHGKPAAVPLKSRWRAKGSGRVFTVVAKLPFGRVTLQEEGRTYFGECQQRSLLATFTRVMEVKE